MEMGVESVENGFEHEKQETSHVLRHYCKVCNKGFGSAGALGGHMRAHVMGDVGNNGGDENLSIIKSEGSKHSYFLRTKTTRFMGYQASDHEDGGNHYRKLSSPSFNRFGMDKERLSPLLSSPMPSSRSKPGHLDEKSASREEEDLANCLVMLSNKSYALSSDNKEESKAEEVVNKGFFQCKACKKVFSSHQALGGHRASHKKVKGCFAAKVDDHGLNDEDNVDDDSIQEDHSHMAPSESDATRSISTRKQPKMHECSVCRRVFSSGQALGGHKRCHWLTTSTDNAFIPSFHDFQYDHQIQQQLYKKPMLTKPHDQHDDPDDNHHLDLNLNLHAPQHDHYNNAGGDSRYDASTTLHLQQLTAASASKIQTTVTNNGEKGCEMKLRKLSDLRDVNLDGGWLQMGIASTTHIR